MKYLITLTLLAIALFAEAQNPIIDQDYTKLLTLAPKANFSAIRTMVKIKFSTAAIAASKTSTIKVSTDADHPANATAIYSGQILPAGGNTLQFDLKGKLDALETFKLGIFENGILISPVIVAELEKPTPQAPKVQVSYHPTPAVTKLVITDFKATGTIDPKQPAEAAFDVTGFKKLYADEKPTELTYVFSGPGCNHFYYKSDKNFKLHVGQPLTVLLNPVPNPLRYDLKVSGKFYSYNDSTDLTLETFLLNPFKLIGKAAAFAGEDNSAAITRKEKVLSYLQEVDSKLGNYMLHLQTVDGIDPAQFTKHKFEVIETIDKYLATAGINYPGNIKDLLLNEFGPDDSVYLKPVLKTFKDFYGLKVGNVYLPIKEIPNVDELRLDVQITPKEKIGPSILSDANVQSIPVFGGFKIDVSPGLFYSFNHQDKYSLRPDSVASTSSGTTTYTRFKTIIKEKQAKGNIGFSTLMHFYSRWGQDVNVAVSLGAGLTLDDTPQVRYLTGISVLLGRENRIAASVGYSFGRVNQLSGRYRNDQTLNSDTTIETYKTLKGSMFIGLSYNIPLLKRKN